MLLKVIKFIFEVRNRDGEIESFCLLGRMEFIRIFCFFIRRMKFNIDLRIFYINNEIILLEKVRV